MTEEVDDPEWDDVIEAAVEGYLGELATAFPAVVLSWDRDKGRASVAPVVREREIDPETSAASQVLGKPISNVPWARLANGTAGSTFDLERGDFVQCVVNQRSISEFLSNGNRDNTPAHPRKHDRSDAAIVGIIRPFSDPLPASAFAAGVHTIYGDEVRLGDATASDLVALASLVKTELNSLWLAVNTHTHLAGELLDSTGSPCTGTTDLSSSAGSASSVAADKVKAT